MMKNWLYLEPYVYVRTTQKDVLFYNTLNGFALESSDPEVIKLAARLKHWDNLYVVGISDEKRNVQPFVGLIETLRQQFMADIIRKESAEGKPMQFMPIMKNMREISYLKKARLRSPGENVFSYLNRVNFYINESCQLDCGHCAEAHKQFFSCFRGKKGTEMPLEQIEKLVQQLSHKQPAISVTGGNVLNYSRLEELCQLLQQHLPQAEFFLHLEQAVAAPEKLKVLVSYGFSLQVGVTAPYDVEKVKLLQQVLGKHLEKSLWVVVVQNEADIEEAEQLLEQARLEKFRFQPFYNGDNASFFKQCVFSEREQVAQQCLTQKEIFGRSKSNPLQFGALTILADGQVYANLNAGCLGTLDTHFLQELILKELTNGKNWLRSRNKVTPCRSCVWNAICPPISNYEYALSRHDLCWKN